MLQNKTMSSLRRYRSLAISFVLFVLILGTVLVFNYYVAEQISESNARLDAIGEVSDETLFLNNTLNQLNLAQKEGDSAQYSEQSQSLAEHLSRIQQLFHILKNGGDYETEESTVHLEAATHPDSIAGLNDFSRHFAPLQKMLQPIVSGQFQAEPIAAATAYANEHVHDFYDNMDNLYDVQFGVTEDYSAKAKYSQIAMAVITGLYLIVFLFYFIRQLSRADQQVAQAKQEVDNIMATVQDGLFLVDNQLQIGSQYSKNLENILGRSNIAHQNLEVLLSELISERDMEATRLFISQLMNKKVVAELVEDLNPLSRVELNQGETSRWLSFQFSRVMVGDEINQVLVSAADITKEVNLETQLAQAKEEHNEDVALIEAMTHCETALLPSFMSKSKQTAQAINALLRNQDLDEPVLRAKLDEIFREVHNLKGEASAVDFSLYRELCQNFEAQIQSIRALTSITGNDFLSIAVCLEDLEHLNSRVARIQERLLALTGTLAAPETQLDEMTQVLYSLSTRVASREGKQVALFCEGLEDVPSNIQPLLRDILVQMVRNAVVHGIEMPVEREMLHKPKRGKISIRHELWAGQHRVVIEDDGRGIDYQQLAQLAIRHHIEPQENGSYTRRQLHWLMLNSGVSTAQNVSEDAGQGIGSAVVLDRMTQLKGKMAIESQAGQYTRFTILI